MKLERSFNRKLYLNMAVKSTGSKQSSIHYAEQYLVNLDLRTMVEQRLKKIYERLCLHFYPVGSFSFLEDEPDPRYL